MNERERELWIDKDEDIFNWWKDTKLSKRKFMRIYRKELDAVIKRVRGYGGSTPAPHHATRRYIADALRAPTKVTP